MFCPKCGVQLAADVRFCAKCGAPVQDPGEQATAFAPATLPVPEYVAPVQQPVAAQNYRLRKIAVFKPLSLVVLVVCAILWFVLPFMAVNVLTMGDHQQPSAFQIIIGDVVYFGDLTDTPAFLGAVASSVGMVLCILLVLIKKNGAVRVVAILTDLLLIVGASLIFEEYLVEVIGVGYVIIFLLFFALCFTSGRRKVVQQPVPAQHVQQPFAAPQVLPLQPQPPQPTPAESAEEGELCAACGRPLAEEEWKCPACGAFRE